MMISDAEYELRVRELEAEGLTRSDAQGVVDAEVISEQEAQKEKRGQQQESGQ